MKLFVDHGSPLCFEIKFLHSVYTTERSPILRPASLEKEHDVSKANEMETGVAT